MLPIRRLARIAVALSIASAGAAPASASIIARMIQKRRAEYQLHKQVGAGPVVAAIPGRAGLRGAILEQKAGATLRQRLKRKKDVPAIRTSVGTSSPSAR